MQFRWNLAEAQPESAKRLAKSFEISALLAQCLINRGHETEDSLERFLFPRLKKLSDPFLLPNMKQAVHRLFQARERSESLVIFGDYDVDGVTSTTILYETLKSLGWIVHCYLPHRLHEGYGLTSEGAANCLKRYPTRLFLAVDCGSTAVDTIAELKSQGVEVIVLDHHQVSDPPPEAYAVVNPQLAGPDEPSFRELCSAGLAFKLAHAIVKMGKKAGWSSAWNYDLKKLLDLVALGTIADLVPLLNENRILTSVGLDRLNRTNRPGIRALMEVAQVRQPVGVYEVGFQLGPRLNAAGRLENAEEALSLFMADSSGQAEFIAQALDARNRERQQIEQQIVEEVINKVKARFRPDRDWVIVEGCADWHVGVIGIVASRLMREFSRPTIVIGSESGEWRGSGRSVEGFDLAAALRECDELLLRHGGHAMAAGLTIDPAHLDSFRVKLNHLASQALTKELLKPKLRLDAEIMLGDLTLEQLEDLERIQPTGQANPPIQLMVKNVWHKRPPRRIGRDKQHAKLWITDGEVTHEAVAWRVGGGRLPEGKFDLAFAPQINQFQGRRSVQLKALDWNEH